MSTSLRDQLLRRLLPVVALTLLLGPLGVYMIAVDATAESLDDGLAESARRFADELRSRPPGAVIDMPPEAQRLLLVTADDRVFFSLRDARGRLLAGDPRLAEDRPWGNLAAPEFFNLGLDGYWLRATSMVFDAGGRALHLVIATTSHKREHLVRDIMLGMVAPQILLSLITIALVWAGIGQGLAPLASLRRDLKQRSHLDLRPLDAEQVATELQPIVVEVNRLMGRLDLAIGMQRRFIADAAHQLRTPVAGLLAQIETAAPTMRPELVTSTRRLSRLVAQLLALSRSEPGAPLEQSPFALDGELRQLADDWLPTSFRRGIDLQFELDPVVAFGSVGGFREIAANLIDNALRYGRHGGRIVVGCHAEAAEAVFVVDDDGPGIPPEFRERVTERFFRLPGTAGEGSGLGLAIVAALAEQQSARFSLDTSPLGGLRAEIRFRRADQE